MPIGSTDSVPSYELNDRKARCGALAKVSFAAVSDEAMPLMRVYGWSDRCAVFISSPTPVTGLAPDSAVQVEWALYWGTECAMEQTPAGLWTPTYNPLVTTRPNREGLVGEAWGRIAWNWTLYARIMDPAVVGTSINVTVAMLAGLGGSSTPPGSFTGSQGA